MTAFSYNLVLALFLLAPGFLFIVGFFHGASTQGGVRLRPPAPNSLAALTIVPVAALGAHLIMSSGFWIMERACAWTGRCLEVAFDPDPYILLFSKNAPVGTSGIVSLLFVLSVAAAMAGALGYFIAGRDWQGKNAALYKWMGAIVDSAATGEDRIVMAYVVTQRTNKDDIDSLGYEGILEEIFLDSEGVVTSIVLRQAGTFYLRMGKDGATKIKGNQKEIRLISFRADEIQNVAVDVLPLADLFASLPPDVLDAIEGAVPAQGADGASPAPLFEIAEAVPAGDEPVTPATSGTGKPRRTRAKPATAKADGSTGEKAAAKGRRKPAASKARATASPEKA